MQGKYKSIHEAVKAGDVVQLELLVKSGCSLNQIDSPKTRFTPLHWSAFVGSLECMHWLLWHGADVTDTTQHGWTPAHIAAIRGQDACIQALGNNGADMNSADLRGSTPVHLASTHGNTYTLQSILRFGADLTIEDRNGWTGMHCAAYHGRLGCTQILNKWGAALDCVDSEGNTPAHLAAMEGHIDVLKYVVVSSSNPIECILARNDRGEIPKDCAIQFYKKKCIDYLEQIEFDKDHPESAENLAFPAHVAALNGDLDHLKMLIEQGIVGLNERDDKGATPAHKAAGNGHLRCLQWLMEMGADFNIKNSADETPLDVAKRFAQLACIRFLGGDEEDELAPGQPGQISPRDPGTGDIDVLHMSEVQKREAKGRALRKVDELTRALTIAKENYKQLGGELEEEKLQSELLHESERVISDLNAQLEYERIRREKLEVQLDELRLENSRLRDEIDMMNANNQDSSSESDAKLKKKKKSSKSKASRPLSVDEKTSGVFMRKSLGPKSAAMR